MNKKTKDFFETVVIIAIFLVLIQTFLDDLSIIAGWGNGARKILIISGFFFDLFFSIEFLIRLYSAIVKRSVGSYLLRQRGWIDFIASIPLLLFNSLPLFLTLFAGGSVFVIGGLLNIVKVVKAVRVARVLRLLRVLKVFKKIKFANSLMAQRHSTKAITISVAGFIIPYFILTIILASFGLNFIEEKNNQIKSEFLTYLNLSQQEEEVLSAITKVENLVPDVLIVKLDGETIYSRFDNDYYNTYFGPTDYDYLEGQGFGVFYDLRELNQSNAVSNLILFCSIIFVVIIFLVLFSTEFALTLSDPVMIMLKGMSEDSYNLQVKIPEDLKDEEIYQLADRYNNSFLPDKARKIEESGAQSELKIEDIKDLFGDLT